MPLYLTLARGPRADHAIPIVATSDPSVVDAVLEALRRLGDDAHDPSNDAWVPSLRLVDRLDDAAEGSQQ
jgi:hypothetical protein